MHFCLPVIVDSVENLESACIDKMLSGNYKVSSPLSDALFDTFSWRLALSFAFFIKYLDLCDRGL